LQFWDYLQQVVRDTEQLLSHISQPERQATLKSRLEMIRQVQRQFRQLFTLPQEEPGLPFDESEKREP
jgi:hypothetical protein